MKTHTHLIADQISLMALILRKSITCPFTVCHLTSTRSSISMYMDGGFASGSINKNLAQALEQKMYTFTYGWATGSVYYPGQCGVTIKLGDNVLDYNAFDDSSRTANEYVIREFTFTSATSDQIFEASVWCITSTSFDHGAPDFSLSHFSLTESCEDTTIAAGNLGPTPSDDGNFIDSGGIEDTVTDNQYRWYGSTDMRIRTQDSNPNDPVPYEGTHYM